MRFIIENNNIKNRNLLKDIISYKKINKLIKSRYEIKELKIINKELILILKNLQTGEKFNSLAITTFNKFKEKILNINNKLYFYYFDKNKFKQNYNISKDILFIVFNNLKNDSFLCEKVVEILNFNNKFCVNPNNTINIQNFLKELNLNLIRSICPDVIHYEILSSMNTDRLHLILYDKYQKLYFLKIYDENRKFINKFIKLNSILNKRINTPSIIDWWKLKLSNSENEVFLLLFDYIEGYKSKISENINLVIKELVKLHNLKIKGATGSRLINFFEGNTFSKKFSNLYTNHNIDRHLLNEAYNYFRNNPSPKGWCNFDIKGQHFIFTRKEVYLVDFDDIKYDYVILDFAEFINRLIVEGQSNLAIKAIKIYFNINKKIKWNKELLYHSSILMSMSYRSINVPLKHRIQLINNFYNNL